MPWRTLKVRPDSPPVRLSIIGSSNVRDTFVAAVQEAGAAASLQLSGVAAALADEMKVGRHLDEEHTRIAERAKGAVLRSYDQLVTRQKKVPSYREGEGGRLAGGVLRDTLKGSALFHADKSGIQFVNSQYLDERAAHWHRLNFGAAPAGQGSRGRFEVTIDNLIVAVFGFEQGPSPAFAMPPGVWLHGGEMQASDPSMRGAGSTGQFYPRGGRRRRRPGTVYGARTTAGIEARNFLDAGLNVIAEEIGPAYQKTYRRWYLRATKEQQAQYGSAGLSLAVDVRRRKNYR